ncbi:MAG: hypothetical protein ABI332_03030 [Polyangiaceae bacterium]
MIVVECLALGAFVGCGGASGNNGFADADAGTGPAQDGGLTKGENDSGGLSGSDGGTTTVGPTIFYVHTDTTLYSLDPKDISATPTKIGDFDCIDGSGDTAAMTDIGVAKDGTLYGVSQGAAYPLAIKSGSVHCVASWPLPSKSKGVFYGLTVAPENTVSTEETLIAADSAGALWKIDATSGITTQVGTFGGGWGLSGDIVFLANGGSPIGFATVRKSSSDKTDTLIEIDVSKVKPGSAPVMKTVLGAVNEGSWCTNPSPTKTFGSMYGIAAYQDKVYGFSRAGDIVEIHNDDGSGCLINAFPTMKFAGAGVTTSAPVVAPPR